VNAKSLLAAKRRATRQDRADVATKSSVKNVLVVDVGGTSVKILATGQSERRSFTSGPTLTPRRMVSEVKKLAGDWMYDVALIASAWG
jgi:polyphosphate glucokinase